MCSSGLLSSALDLLLPVACAGCERAGTWLCPGCRAALAGAAGLAGPSPAPAGLPAVTAAAPYEGVVRAMLVSYKERGVLRLVRPLGGAVARAVRALPAPPVGSGGSAPLVLVPVPSRASAVRLRGHDPTYRLAAAAAQELGGRVERLLRQVRAVRDQAGLGTAARAANLAGALAARGPGPGRAGSTAGRPLVVLVDDVVTTGATLAEAARALRAAGHEVLGAAVVAATPRRSLAVRAGLG